MTVMIVAFRKKEHKVDSDRTSQLSSLPRRVVTSCSYVPFGHVMPCSMYCGAISAYGDWKQTDNVTNYSPSSFVGTRIVQPGQAQPFTHCGGSRHVK